MATIDNQKRDLLAAIAQQGQAGAAQYQQNGAKITQGASQAIDASTGRTSVANAPAALRQKLTASAAAPFQAAASDNALAQGAFQAANAAQAGLSASYADQIKQATPIVNQYVNAQIAQIQAQKEAQARQDAMAQENINWQREQRQWARDDRTAAMKVADSKRLAEFNQGSADENRAGMAAGFRGAGLDPDVSDSVQVILGKAGNYGEAIEALQGYQMPKDADPARQKKIQADLQKARQQLDLFYNSNNG